MWKLSSKNFESTQRLTNSTGCLLDVSSFCENPRRSTCSLSFTLSVGACSIGLQRSCAFQSQTLQQNLCETTFNRWFDIEDNATVVPVVNKDARFNTSIHLRIQWRSWYKRLINYEMVKANDHSTTSIFAGQQGFLFSQRGNTFVRICILEIQHDAWESWIPKETCFQNHGCFCQTVLRRAERYPAEKYCPMVQMKNAAAGFTATGDQITLEGIYSMT